MKFPSLLKGRLGPQPRGQKVFCVGFNKTGTTSLHQFFVDCGLRSVHETQWPHHSRIKDGATYFDRAQCFSDGEAANFRQLDKWFPSSLFVLNTRNERDWVRSRVKHVLRAGVPNPRSTVEHGTQYGEMARRFYSDEAPTIASWVLDRRIYEGRVRTYFRECKRFTVISVADDPDWHTTLFSHLEKHALVPKSRTPSPPVHANFRMASDVPDREALERYLSMADRVLAQLDSLGTDA